MTRDALYMHVLCWGGCLLLVGAVFIVAWATAADPQSLPNRYWTRYIANLDRKLHLMFIWRPAWHIGYGQIAVSVAIVIAHLVVGVPFWYAAIAAVAVYPPMHVEKMRKKRVVKLEGQLDGFMLTLANALKTVPSVAAALVSMQSVLQPPVKDEVELAIKEMKVGSTLDQALLNFAGRIGSRQLDNALSVVLIGRQIGGDLPRVLETTAATYREMARLEGVVRAKTAEARMQLYVLALFPFGLVLAFNALNPDYFAPLRESIFGYIIVVVASLLWLASLLLARKILRVDI